LRIENSLEIENYKFKILTMDCIFCKIVEGELPSAKIYEDKRILAFLDINPVNKGHTLVITKEHYNNLNELPPDLLKDVIMVVQRLSLPIREAVGAEGFNIIVNNGRVAGQLVDHVHFHIIPRLKQDNLHPWPGKTYQENEKERLAENIRKLL
jgi:histidine triad (HIT) family protein